MREMETRVNEAHGITDLLIDIFLSKAAISPEGRTGLVTVLDCLKQRIPTDDEVLEIDRLHRERATQ